QSEVQRMNLYQAKLRNLETQGSSVVPENQELDLAFTVQNQAQSNHVVITRSNPVAKASNSPTNQFFEEQAVSIGVNTGTEELVNFLVSLTSTNSLIRVKDMTL